MINEMKDMIEDTKEALDSGSLDQGMLDDIMYEYGFDGDPLDLLEELI